MIIVLLFLWGDWIYNIMAGIFKKNDIRGVFGETLTEELTYQIAVN